MPIRNALGTAAAALARTLRGSSGVAAVSITYRRGDDSVSVAASVGRTLYADASGDAGSIGFESKDFIVTAADLEFDGVAVTPVANDEIVQGSEVFRVSAPPGQEPYQYDPTGTTLRIHTTRI